MASTNRVTTWISGDTLTAAALNAEFDNLLTGGINNIANANIASAAAISYSKLNLSGSIVAGDIASSAVTTAKINDLAVTTGKIADGAATSRKIAPTFSRATNGSAFTTSSTSFADVTDISVSVTLDVTSNVIIIFSGSWYHDTTNGQNTVQLLRGSTEKGTQVSRFPFTSAEGPMSIIGGDTSLAAGSYTIKAQMKVSGGNGTISAGAQLLVIVFAA